MEDYTLLRDVNTSSQNWTIKTRLVRFCDFNSPHEPSRRLRIDMILLDEEGTAIEAQVPEIWQTRSKIFFKEDHVYKINYFHVVPAKNNYRAVQHPCMVQFTPYTKIEEITNVPQNFPLYAHAAIIFDELKSRINNDNITSDAIGLFVGSSDIRDQVTRGGGTKQFRNIMISNGRESISIALWGKHAQTFPAQECMELSQKDGVVLLFCAMTCRTFNDKLSLHGSALCRWYIDPDLHEAYVLRERYHEAVGPAIWLDQAPQRGQYEQTTINDLAAFENPHTIDDKRFVITGKIKSVTTNQPWWYLGCTKCNRRMQEVGDSHQCSNPSCNSTTGTTRYRLSVQVVDPEASMNDNNVPSVQLVFFGPTAEEIIGSSVHDLINKGAGTENFMPSKIKQLFGKILHLRISLARFSFKNPIPNITYQVNAVLGVRNPENDPAAEAATPQSSEPIPLAQNKEGTVAIVQQQIAELTPKSLSVPQLSETLQVEKKRLADSDDNVPTDKSKSSHSTSRRKLSFDDRPKESKRKTK